MSEKRTVRELSMLGEKVYVYLKDESTGETFLQAAEAEGFTFGDGAKPTQRHWSSVMAVDSDGTIHYVCAMGMMGFGAKAKEILRVDFAAFYRGDGEYLY